MMDPRNSINASDVFQFLELSYDQKTTYSKDKIKSMLSGSFLQDEKYTNTIMDACKKYNVNPYYIVARILQEQKKEGTTLTKGQGYNGKYVGYYNVFNIGAAGNGTEKVILNGLAKAEKNKWDSLEKSISGGIEIIAKQYIAIGQNTMYLQKFDVDNTDGNMYWHQYMQNILAAQSEGETLRKTFLAINALYNGYNFIIPVYENMPKEAVPRPATTKDIATISADIVTVNVNSSLKIRSEPAGNNTVGYVYANEVITRIEKASQKINGTYWDKILSSRGIDGYVARCTYDGDDDYKLYLVPLEKKEEKSNDGVNKVSTTVSSKDTTKLNASGTKAKINNTDYTIITEPNMKIKDLQNNIKEKIVVKDQKGQILKEDATLATGYTVNEKYKVVILGDVNCDGEIDTGDTFFLKLVVLGKRTLNEQYLKKACDINQDGDINTGDTFLLKKHVLGLAKITL